MSKILSVHSFRGGTGKSNIVANLAVLLAQDGHRVGVVDTDIQSPGIHVLFGLDTQQVTHTLNDYLLGQCPVEKAAYDVSLHASADATQLAALPGRVYLIPSSMKVNEITTVISQGYDVGLLTAGYADLCEQLQLDYLLIDTHPGVNEETLLSIGISNVLLVILRPDYQDYQGTALTVKIAKELDVPQVLLVVNKVLADYDGVELRQQMEATYQTSVAAVLPLYEDVIRLASRQVFCLSYPNHPLVALLRQVLAQVSG